MLIPAGSYKVKAAQGWQWKKAETGTVFFEVEFPVRAVVDGQNVCVTLAKQFYFPKDKPDHTKRNMASLGYMGYDGTPLEELKGRVGGLDKNEVSIEVSVEKVMDKDKKVKMDADGKPLLRNKVEWVNQGSGFGKPAELSDIAGIANMIRRVTKDSGNGAGHTDGPDGIPDGSGQTVDNTDIPF